MDLTALIKCNLSPKLKNDFSRHLLLKPGDRVRAHIIDVKQNNMVLIDLGKFKALAEINFPVRPGQIIPLKVMETDHQLKLRLERSSFLFSNNIFASQSAISYLDPDKLKKLELITAKILDFFGTSKDKPVLPGQISNALINLASSLKPLDPNMGGAELAPKIENIVENSGSYFEKKLAEEILLIEKQDGKLSLKQLNNHLSLNSIIKQDLKPNLFFLRDFLIKENFSDKLLAHKEVRLLKEVVDKIISRLDEQAKNLAGRLQENNPWQIFNHIIFQKGVENPVGLKIYYQKKTGKSSDEKPRISILLKMDRLGNIRTDILFLNEVLNITFFVENDNVKQIVEQNYHKIRNNLQNLFKSISLKSIKSTSRIEKFEADEQHRPGTKLVDLLI